MALPKAILVLLLLAVAAGLEGQTSPELSTISEPLVPTSEPGAPEQSSNDLLEEVMASDDPEVKRKKLVPYTRKPQLHPMSSEHVVDTGQNWTLR